MINPNNFRPSFELNLFNDLLKNSSFNKASESHLKKISLDHSQKNTLDFLTNGIRINNNNSPLLYKTFNEIKKKLVIGRLNVDLFIENDPSINAGLAFIKKSNYIVFLNSLGRYPLQLFQQEKRYLPFLKFYLLFCQDKKFQNYLFSLQFPKIL